MRRATTSQLSGRAPASVSHWPNTSSTTTTPGSFWLSAWAVTSAAQMAGAVATQNQGHEPERLPAGVVHQQPGDRERGE